MSSIATGGYKSIDVENPKGKHVKASIIVQRIPNHINGHSVRPNRVALKYPNF
jgi:hypothetical protein